MKSIFTGLCVGVFLVGACELFASESTTVKEGESTLTVTTVLQSSPQAIWNAIVDFKNYDQWNVYTISGEARLGATVQMHSKGFEGSWFIDHLDLKIYKMEKNSTLCWIDVSNFTYLGAGGWRCRHLKPLADGKVALINHFEYTGIFWWLLKYKTYDDLIKGLKDENEALKKYVEAFAAPAVLE